MTQFTIQNPARSETRVPLRVAAADVDMSALGLQKLLARTGNLIRDDGHWYVQNSVISEIKRARTVLGLKSRLPIAEQLATGSLPKVGESAAA